MLSEHAKTELARIKDDGYGGMVKEAVQELVDNFAEQGHSGFSAEMTTQAVERLFRFLPLTSLTGEDDEWMEVGSGTFQNRRCSKIFKEDNKAYSVDDPDRAPITFPYLPGVR